MPVFIGKTFVEDTISIDDNTYRNCEFKSCVIVYAGGEVPILQFNKFINCEWIFDGASRRTLQFLASLYRAGGKDLIDGIIKEITAQPNVSRDDANQDEEK